VGSLVTSIRPMTRDDLADVVRLERDNRPRPWTEGEFISELEAADRVYLVADEEETIGFAGVVVMGDEAHVTNLLVDPASRGRGVGRLLMLSVIGAAVDMGARHLTLEVGSVNDSARSLYSGLGLVPVGVRPGYYGDDDAFIMWAHDIDRPGFLEGLR